MSSIAALLPTDLDASPEDVDVLLELLYLVAAADGRLLDEELASFRAVAARLRGKEAIDDAELDAILERVADAVDPDEIEGRVGAVASSLRKELHDVAYKLALAMAFVDWDPSKEEDRLHRVLAGALGLDGDRRAALSREIALGGP
jgi:uncharacterized tellurite resistance protein B-like protein